MAGDGVARRAARRRARRRVDVTHRREPSRRRARSRVDALVRVEDGAYAHILLPELLREHDARRARPRRSSPTSSTARCACAARSTTSSQRCRRARSTSLDPAVRAALRLGAYQLVDGVSPHAAVGETVGVVPERARGFANGVLRGRWRGSGRRGRCPTATTSTAIGDAHVASRLDRADASSTSSGPTTRSRRSTLDNEPPRGHAARQPVRTTRRRRSTAELRGRGVDVERGDARAGRAARASHRRPRRARQRCATGRATPQDQASQAVVAALDPQPGDRVLDVARRAGRQGDRPRPSAWATTAWSSRPTCTRRASDRRSRGRDAARRSRVGRAGRGRRPRACRCATASFDRVLLDAPCSGLGVLRRRPDARWRVEPHDVDRARRLQRELLARRGRARCGPAGGSSTRCARSPAPRRSASTRSPASELAGASSRCRRPARRGGRTGAARCSLPSAARHRRHVRPRARPFRRPTVPGSQRVSRAASVKDRAVDPRRRLRGPRGRRRPRRGRGRPAARRLMDGHYVPNLSIGAAGRDGAAPAHRPVPRLPPDGRQPGCLLDDFAEAGADGCTVHVELGDPRPLFDEIARARHAASGSRSSPRRRSTRSSRTSTTSTSCS